MLAGGARRAPSSAQRLEVYRNNAWQFFLAALERTYPVTQRRVGADFFRQLAREYRAQHPSQHGDLHWIGEAFPAWLADRMTGTGYEWLADLARLEWACETCRRRGAARPGRPGVARPFRSGRAAGAGAGVAAFAAAGGFTVSRSGACGTQTRATTNPRRSTWRRAPSFCVVACAEDRVVVYRLGADRFRGTGARAGRLEPDAGGVPRSTRRGATPMILRAGAGLGVR